MVIRPPLGCEGHGKCSGGSVVPFLGGFWGWGVLRVGGTNAGLCVGLVVVGFQGVEEGDVYSFPLSA